jgi:iron complex transport system permease protein
MLTVLLTVSVLLNIGLGAVRIQPPEVASILLARVGVDTGVTVTPQQTAVLMAIRLPRVLLGVLVGAALAVSGATMQGLFRNPLADPGLLGVSSGAALAAVSVIVLGGSLPWLQTLLGAWLLPLAAFAGGLLVTWFVYTVATRAGRTEVATMLLAGVAINALAGAGTGLLVFLADDNQLRDITFWNLGSLGGVTWRSLTAVSPFMLAAIFLLPRSANDLNAFLLGESEARHLGVNTQRVKRLVVFLSAAAVGAAVSVAGIIGFVGLVVPHLIRLAAGPDHRLLLPASVLLGASLLLLADLFARTVVIPAELPIGIVTALAGAPFFLWLLLRGQKRLEAA